MSSHPDKMNPFEFVNAISFLIVVALLVAAVLSIIWEINWHPVVVKLWASAVLISGVVCFFAARLIDDEIE